MSGLEGAYQQVAWMTANESEPVDGVAGLLDRVSSEYLALYWLKRGAKVGKRVRDTIRWLNGQAQMIREIKFSEE